MGRKIVRLCLVYDANSGKLGAWIDSTRKILMIKGCALCTITHGITGERQEWRSCKAQVGVPIDYFHRDDMPAPIATAARALPCILAEIEGGEFEMLLPPESLAECGGSVSLVPSRGSERAGAVRAR